jgi:hypothetical protein
LLKRRHYRRAKIPVKHQLNNFCCVGSHQRPSLAQIIEHRP